ncbi:hypothetical protein SAMN05216228_102484 [Rhizobium tibeticum]|uniref:Uncharacterized protein n=2 Tax=Rhizobium tibeticum TaxID=501024 RepID=A0A1H8SEU3_9HYPH|nr:hypothetical protein [Rhizobium tibeticum]SEI12476.1 hypothetical protein RTCCBAU85039_4821 [Rhizobium tibeticum]SEO77260.1 hypothetical protein SAMN05216228_102484 [Rhizobium tibeticum]
MPYDAKPGEVSLFENEKMGRESAPDHQGYVVAHRDIKAGEKLSIALWAGKPNSARSFSGKIADLPRAGDRTAPTDLFGNPLSGAEKTSR